MKFSKIICLSAILLMGGNVWAQKKTKKFEKLQIEMFPKAKDGYKMVYIQLPVEKNENDLKVEFFAGIEKKVDCNRHFLIGDKKLKEVQGWGYNYYEIDSKGETGSTLMACPDQKLTLKFVFLQPEIANYNSKLPLVLYVPKDMEVRYRILRPDLMKKVVGKL